MTNSARNVARNYKRTNKLYLLILNNKPYEETIIPNTHVADDLCVGIGAVLGKWDDEDEHFLQLLFGQLYGLEDGSMV